MRLFTKSVRSRPITPPDPPVGRPYCIVIAFMYYLRDIDNNKQQNHDKTNISNNNPQIRI